MVSAANKAAIEAAGLTFILGARIPHVPYHDRRLAQNPSRAGHSGRSGVHPALAGQRRRIRPPDHDRTIYYQYRADRARRTLRGIDEQVGKAQRPSTGRSRSNATGSSPSPAAPDRQPRPGDQDPGTGRIKGYVTNLPNPTAGHVIGAYHQLWQVEKSFRMSKHDLQARPIYHRHRDSIEAHLTIVFAALAVSRWIETTPAGASRRFVRTSPPLPHHRDPGRRTHHHRRRPPTRRPPPGPRPRSGTAVRTKLSQVRSSHTL